MRTVVAAIDSGDLDAVAALVISNNGDAPALEFARDSRIKAFHISKRTARTEAAADRAIADALAEAEVDLVVLSGYLRKVGPATLEKFRGRILNIHPSLLPRHGGKGMYGRFVHEAVIEGGDRFSGATIHIVDAEYDHGPVISQKVVPVLADDTPDSLKARVMAIEGQFFLEVLQQISDRENRIVPLIHHRFVSAFRGWRPGGGRARSLATYYWNSLKFAQSRRLRSGRRGWHVAFNRRANLVDPV